MRSRNCRKSIIKKHIFSSRNPPRRRPPQSQPLQRPPNNSGGNAIPQGDCPAINSLPDISSCNGMVSNCWSVGQADVDCPGNALCCFDGCRNTCYFGGEVETQTLYFRFCFFTTGGEVFFTYKILHTGATEIVTFYSITALLYTGGGKMHS